IREINALVHIKNEMLDEAFGRVLAKLEERGWGDDTDIVLTSDHGEFQGDLGLLFKGPYHVDALTRLPMVWRPARSAGVPPAVVTDPVGQIDLAPTFCEIAGVPVPEWMQGAPLPQASGSEHERAIIEWDSQLDTGYRMRSIVQDGWSCTVYEPNDPDYGLPKAERYASFGMEAPTREIVYDGTEGELYHLEERSEERRVGKENRCRQTYEHSKKINEKH